MDQTTKSVRFTSCPLRRVLVKAILEGEHGAEQAYVDALEDSGDRGAAFSRGMISRKSSLGDGSRLQEWLYLQTIGKIDRLVRSQLGLTGWYGSLRTDPSTGVQHFDGYKHLAEVHGYVPVLDRRRKLHARLGEYLTSIGYKVRYV